MPNHKYRLSFTAAALFVADMETLASYIVNDGLDIEALNPEMLQRSRANTNKRVFSELMLRIKNLSAAELEILANGDSSNKKLVSLLAFGRTYKFFRDFIEDVLIERISLYDYKLSEGYYNTFFFNKSMEHPELEELADSTKYKIKQVCFRVLVEADILDSLAEKNIQLPFLDTALIKAVSAVDPNDLNILLYKP